MTAENATGQGGLLHRTFDWGHRAVLISEKGNFVCCKYVKNDCVFVGKSSVEITTIMLKLNELYEALFCIELLFCVHITVFRCVFNTLLKNLDMKLNETNDNIKSTTTGV